MGKNVILTEFDVNQDWPFRIALEKETGLSWKIEVYKLNFLRNSFWKKLCVYVGYFWNPFRVFLHRKEYDRIVAWQQFYGLIYGFFCRLFHAKKYSEVIVMTFIFKEKKGLEGWIYRRFMRYIVTSIYIDRFVVFSKKECSFYSQYFQVPKEKFVFMKVGAEDKRKGFSCEKGDRVLSVGRSNRDYDFLIHALEGTNIKGDILCDTYKHVNTDNFCIYNDVLGDKYYEMLSKAFCVLIPLKDTKISSGQLVLIQAMMFEKPVIITRTQGSEDYVRDGITALVIDKSKDALLDALERLHDEEFYTRIVREGRREYDREFSLESLAKNMANLMK